MEYVFAGKCPDSINQFSPNSLDVIRHSIFIDQKNNPIPTSQVMPKYIPKEPVKGCVSSPVGGPRCRMSSRRGSSVLSELDSDTWSVVTQATANNRLSALSSTDRLSQLSQGPKAHRKRAKSKTKKRAKVKQRPVNVVGPIVSSLTANADDKDDIFSASGAESLESEGDNLRLREDLLAREKLITKLQEDLNSQLKVNAELKKLLVASVGNDLEYRVEKLAQDKAQLSATVGSYSEKLYKDFEDLDRISIQADMWRSKYLASRVQADELSEANSILTNKYAEATSALQNMLEERQLINNNLKLAHRMLECVSSTPSSNRSEPVGSRTTQQLSDQLLALANHIASQPLPNKTFSTLPPVDSSTEDELSYAETAAFSVLSDQLIPTSVLEVPITEEIPRSPSLFCQTRVTSHKKGEVMVV